MWRVMPVSGVYILIRLLLCIVICLLPLGQAQAGVYRWVDDAGRVHFGDRPPGDQATELELPAAEPEALRINPQQLDDERKARRQKLLDAYEEERQQKREALRKREAEEQKRSRNCAIARDRLRRYEHSSALYQPLEDGGRRVLSKAERRSATERARQAVEQWCED